MQATKFVLSLPAADLQRSQQFYQAVIGLGEIPIEDNMLMLELPGLSLYLIQEKEFESYTQKFEASALHDAGQVGSILTYGLATLEELGRLMQNAEAAGATIKGPTEQSWGHTGYFRDPDGHLWELVWNDKMSAQPLLPVNDHAQPETPEATAAMLIRKPVSDVFEAFCNPATMAKLWFTYSSGPIKESNTLTWKWEQFGIESQVHVKQVVANEFISFTWEEGPEEPLVEISFEDKGGHTFMSVSETGFRASDPALVKKIAGQTEGWSLVLTALKAYLEHGLVLQVVSDRYPQLTSSETNSVTVN